MEPSTRTSTATATTWPDNTDIGFYRGIIIAAFLTVALPLIEVAVVHLFGIGYTAETMRQAVIILPIHVVNLLLVGVVVSKWGHIHLRSLLWGKLPTWKESFKWGSVGALFGLTSFFKSMNSGYRFDNPEVNLFIFMVLVKVSVLTPLIEEIQDRAVLYAALRKKGRLLAYIVSSVVFTVSHAQSYADLFFRGDMGLSTWQVIGLFLAGLVFAHIYEKTGKLLLCIICHAMINGMEVIGYVAGYVFDV